MQLYYTYDTYFIHQRREIRAFCHFIFTAYIVYHCHYLQRSAWERSKIVDRRESSRISVFLKVGVLQHNTTVNVNVIILQRVRIARNADLSVCPFVCPSVTFRCFVQTNKDTMVRFSASGKTLILVSGEVKFIRIFAEDHPSESAKVRRSLSLAKNWPIIGHNLEIVQEQVS